MSEQERGEGEGRSRRRYPSEKIRALLGKDEDEFNDLLGESVDKAPSFTDAILGLWSKLDGFNLEGETFGAQPFSSWPTEQLKQEYSFWSAFKAEDQQGTRVESFVETRAAILEGIRNAAKDRGDAAFATVVLGNDWGARSAGETSEIPVGEIKRENETVGNYFDKFVLRVGSSIERPLTRVELLQLQAECQELQERFNFRKRFDQQEVDTYTKAEITLQRIAEYIERELPNVYEPSPQTPVTTHNVEEETRAGILAETRRMNAERMAKEEELRQAGRKDDTYRPQAREVEAIARELLERGMQEGVPELANALARDRHWSGYATGGEKFAPVDLSAERERRVGERKYEVIKRELLANDDWSRYGWSQADKLEISRSLGLGDYQARNLMAAVMLHGETAEEMKRHLSQRGGVYEYIKSLGIAVNDDDALAMLIPSEEERKSMRNREYFQPQPRNIEELAWQIAFETPHMFGEGKNVPYPVLEKTVYFDPRTKKFRLTEWVNEANMLQWMRYAEMQAHYNHTQRAMDFAQEVGIQKEFKKINVYEMLEYKAMGISKYGMDYRALIGEFEKETSNFGLPRASYLDIWHAKTSADEMIKVRKAQGWENNSTRPFYAQSALAWLLKMAERYDRDSNMPSDGKMGAVSNTVFMSYLHLLNPEQMARVLGLGSRSEDLGKIFNLKNLREIRDKSAGGAGITAMIKAEGGTPDADKWLNLLKPEQKINGVKLGDVFDFSTEEGLPKLSTPEQRYKFAKLINFYSYSIPDEHFKTLIRRTIAQQAAKMHGLRTSSNGIELADNLTEAEMIAFYNTWYLGVSGINGVLDESHQWESKTSGMHRWNQVGGRPAGGTSKHEGRAGVAGQYGNVYTIGQFKRILAAPIYAYKTTETGGAKTVHQVFDEAQSMRAELDKQIKSQVERFVESPEGLKLRAQKVQSIRDSLIAAGKLKPTDRVTDEMLDTAKAEVGWDKWDELLKSEEHRQALLAYSKKAEELIFPEDMQLKYYQDHYERAYRLDKRVRGAESLKFDQYIKYVPYVGSTFDQEKWQKDMSAVITDARYAFRQMPLDYTTMMWDWDPYEEKMKQMPLGASMFGQQMVDIPEFKDKNGNFSWDIVNGEKGRVVLFKRWVETYIIGQLLQYRELTMWSTNPRYTFSMTEDILEAIGKIPGLMELDPNDMRRTKVTGKFFSKEAMERIRRESGTTKYGMYCREMLIKGFFGNAGQKDGFFSGLAELFSVMMKESFASVNV